MVRVMGSMWGPSLPRRSAFVIAGAALLIASASIHLDLYLTGYRTIPTIGWLFLLQVIAAFVLAVAVIAVRSWLADAAGAGFLVATLGGYLLSVWVGLFGFREVRTTAGIVAGIIEVAAFAALAALAAMPSSRSAAAWSRRKQPAGSAATLDSARLSSAQAASAAGRSSTPARPSPPGRVVVRMVSTVPMIGSTKPGPGRFTPKGFRLLRGYSGPADRR